MSILQSGKLKSIEGENVELNPQPLIMNQQIVMFEACCYRGLIVIACNFDHSMTSAPANFDPVKI